MIKRDAGVKVAIDAQRWVLRVGEFPMPISAAMRVGILLVRGNAKL